MDRDGFSCGFSGGLSDAFSDPFTAVVDGVVEDAGVSDIDFAARDPAAALSEAGAAADGEKSFVGVFVGAGAGTAGACAAAFGSGAAVSAVACPRVGSAPVAALPETSAAAGWDAAATGWASGCCAPQYGQCRTTSYRRAEQAEQDSADDSKTGPGVFRPAGAEWRS